MPALSFKKQFVEKIRQGAKTQTIRAYRAHPIAEGDKLYLYTAQRTKYSEKIMETACTSVCEICITEDFILLKKMIEGSPVFTTINTAGGLDAFAVADGFNEWSDMLYFWRNTHQLPFFGNLIKWDRPNAE